VKNALKTAEEESAGHLSAIRLCEAILESVKAELQRVKEEKAGLELVLGDARSNEGVVEQMKLF